MSVLTHTAIENRMRSPNVEERLLITPLLRMDQIGDASVDLRLGRVFIVFNRSSIGQFDPRNREEIKKNIQKYQERVRIAKGGTFVLHPQQFVLGATLEYLVLPTSLHGQVSGRSTWGRTGLIIATATLVHPGYKGCITLELVNEGTVPLVLRPLERIAQIMFQKTEDTCKYEGRYLCATGPEFPSFSKPDLPKELY